MHEPPKQCAVADSGADSPDSVVCSEVQTQQLNGNDSGYDDCSGYELTACIKLKVGEASPGGALALRSQRGWFDTPLS